LYDRVQDLLGNGSSTPVLMRRVRRLLAQGQQVPGFDHPLYPKGDPRAAQLLGTMAERRDLDAPSRAIMRFIDAVRTETGMLARQELAVVVLARAMGMPRNLPPVLFVLSRMAGWVAHVQEQRLAGTLLRPRAKYVDGASSSASSSQAAD
jgi:citrate synthase